MKRVRMTGALLLVALGCGRISWEPIDADIDGVGTSGNGGASNASGGASVAGSFASAGVGTGQAGGNSSGAVGGGSSTVGGGSSTVGGGSSTVGGGSSTVGGAFSSDGGAGSADAGAAGEGSLCLDGLALCGDKCTNLRVGEQQGDVVLNCGSCGNTCSLNHANSAACSAGVCAQKCQSGFGNCNPSGGNDGCETPLTTVDNCGGCQRVCSRTGASSRSCVAGQCAPTCAPRYADCNQDARAALNDGCETFLDLLDHCGKDCGSNVACGPSNVCNGGSCVAPNGLAVLSVPAKKNNSSFSQRFANVFPSPINLEGASITIRAYAPDATSGSVVMYVNDTSAIFAPVKVTMDLATLSQRWTDLTLFVSSGQGFNAASVRQVNLDVNVSVKGSSNDSIVVYVDSIRTTNLTFGDNFDSSVGNFVASSLVMVPGSKIKWAATMP